MTSKKALKFGGHALVWAGDWSEKGMKPIFKLQLEQSDVISFHCYDKPKDFLKRINELKRYGKPMLCTEYMARPNGSTFEGFLPIAKENKIAMINWGFVDGKPIDNTPKTMADVMATTEISDILSKDLKKRGFKFVGSTVVYAHMQATGMVDNHVADCWKRTS